MMREMFLENMSLWGCVWQSTLFALFGLIGSSLLRRRPARAAQVLLLGMIAAVTVPSMGVLVRHFELGVLVGEPVAPKGETPSEFVPTVDETSAAVPGPVDTVNEDYATAEQAVLAEFGSERAAIPWRLIVLYGWMTASLVLLGRLLVAVGGGVCLLRRAQPAACEQIKRAAESAGSRFAVTKDLQVRSSANVRNPVIWCWSRSPVLIVANDFDHKIDWVGVICHELAHWRRNDHLAGLIAELVMCILPWNPLLWWSKKRMIRLSEQACDDWVVASGQSREDYAQSLLDFKPQKQVALVPAVVSSKKILAGRVRRILKDGYANPRTGVAWAVTTNVIAIFLAVGIAFAQTRSAQSTGTAKTKVGKSAAIECLASETIMIRGRILNPNNEPAYGASIVSLPVTSWGYHTEPRHRNKEGYFELPWSPTWIEPDERIYLMAVVQDPKTQAALVEVTDPASPVTVRLEPAFAITGKVVDPDGREIEECVATISLHTKFKCRAPIYCFRGGRWWERTLSPLPYGNKYELIVRAEGHRTKRIIIDGTDGSKELIDLGTIVLQPQGKARTVIAEQRPDLELEKEFHEIYALDKDEIIKLIKPPFVLGRQEYFQGPAYHYGDMFDSLDSQGAIQACLLWDDELLSKEGLWAYTNTHRPPTLGTILWLALRMRDYDFDVPKGLNIRMPYGDWIVRADSPKEEQFRSLAEIVYAETKRVIRFEKRTVEREVIVAKGRYEFKSHPSGNYPNYIHLTWDGTLDRSEGRIRSLAHLFGRLEKQLKIIIVAETEPIKDLEGRYKSGDLYPINHDPERREERLRAFLDNLAKTTSLQFKVERRPAEVWFATEVRKD